MPSTSRLASLDALRALAAGMVFLCHAQLATEADLGPFTRVAEGFGVGLGIFFVLSGYLLYRPFVGPGPDIRSYAVRRFFRIMPAYVFALAGASVLIGTTVVLREPLAFLTMTQVYVDDLRGLVIAPSWTLTIELFFYLSLPLVALAIEWVARGNPTSRVRALLWLAVASLVAHFGAALAVVTLSGEASAITIIEVFPLPLWMFAPGMVIAAIEVGQPERFALLRHRGWLVAGAALIVAGVLVHVRIFDVITTVGTALVVGHLVARPPRAGAWSRVAVLAGGLSYAVYLWHWDVLRTLHAAGLSPVHVALAAAVATLGIAAVSWRFVEQPAIALGRAVAASRAWMPALAAGVARLRPRPEGPI